MRRILPTLLLTTVLCSIGSKSLVHAQYGPVPVVEVGPNLTVNTLTSQEMVLQVLNSNQEVEMMRRNLIPSSGGGGGGISDLLKRLDEVLATGEALHYMLSDLDQQMAKRYPGYVNPGRWIPTYTRLTNTSLHTLRGTLNTVHEQFKLPERLREDAILAGLASQSSSARGNLAVTQAGNAITLQVIQELRKVRQLLGATVNAQNVATSHQINLQASQDRIVHDWIARSRIPVQPYRGTGGFGPNDYKH